MEEEGLGFIDKNEIKKITEEENYSKCKKCFFLALLKKEDSKLKENVGFCMEHQEFMNNEEMEIELTKDEACEDFELN